MSVSGDTQKGSEVHSTDLQDRAKMLEFWSEEYKVDVYKKWEEETLLLMCLRTDESDACIMRLVEIECDVNATNIFGRSPLHIAIERPTLMVAIELIKRGADINAQDGIGYTPLHYAVLKDQEAVCMLLYYGADVYVRCYNMFSPFGVAVFRRRFDSIQTLMDYHEDEHLDEDIPEDTNALEFFALPKNSSLFKLAWTCINHDSLTEFRRPFLSTYLDDCKFPTNEWFECLQLILQSDSIIDLIEQFNNYNQRNNGTFIGELLYTIYIKQIEINKRMSTIFMVLSSGIEIYVNDFNDIFEFFGFGPELEALIYTDSETINDYIFDITMFPFALLPFIFALINDFSTSTIVSLLKRQIWHDPDVNNDIKQNHIINALRFFSFNFNAKTELVETFKYYYNNYQIKRVIEEVPEVPSLLELSRNRIYLSIRNDHKIKKPYHFHDAVKNLLLPQKLKDVIIFKRPIY